VKNLLLLVSILLLAGCFGDKNFNFQKFEDDSNLKELKSTIVKFYNYYIEGDTKSMYQMEAPHFRFIYSNVALYNTFHGRKSKEKLFFELKSIQKVSEFRYKTDANLCKKDGNCRYVTDNWIEVDGDIYHLTVGPIFFQEK
jgi:hypothetical protein